MTKWQLFSALTRVSFTTNDPPPTLFPNGKRGWVQSIAREDGSGHKFNVAVTWQDGTMNTIFIQTTD